MGCIECTSMGWLDLIRDLGNSDVLFLAPGIQKATTVSRSLADVLSGVSVVTLDGLVGEIVDSAVPGVRRISLTATEFLVRSILEDLRSDLEYLPDARAFRGTAPAVTRSLLHTVNNHPAAVREGFASAYGTDRLSPHEKDMILVGDEFLRRTYSRHIACADLLKTLALEALESGEGARVRALASERVVVDGVYPAAELDWRLLASLTRVASHTHVLVRGLAGELDGASSIERIRVSLLESRLEDRLASEIGGRQIDCFGTRSEEVQGVARRISELLSENPDLDPCQIGVVVPNLDRYQALIEEHFSAYGLPFEVACGFPLKASPVASIAGTLLSQARLPGDRAGLFQLLSCGLVDAGDIDVQLIDRLARRFNVSNLVALEETLSRMPTEYLPEDDELQNLELSIGGLKSLFRDLGSLAGDLNPQSFVDAFICLMSRLRIVANAVVAPWQTSGESQNCTDSGLRDYWSRRNAAALSGFVDALADVRDSLLLFGDHRNRSLDDLAQMVEDALRDRRYRCRPVEEAVRIMHPLDARGVDLCHCFVLGLVEGEFPAFPDRGFLLQRPIEWQERRREAAHFLLDVIASSEHVWLSAFTSDGSTRFAISPLLRDFRQSIIEEVAAAGQGSESGSYTDFEVQVAAGLDLTQDKSDALLQLLQSRGDLHCLEQLRMEVYRENKGQGNPYGGDVQPSFFDLRDRVYSVTQLETYVRCPFLYMARYILGIEPLEEVEDELESSEMGSLVHGILSEFGRRGGFRMLKTNMQAAKHLLLEIAESSFGDTVVDGSSNLFLRVQYERLVEGLEKEESESGLLRRFLDAQAGSASSLIPTSFEFDFQFIIDSCVQKGSSGLRDPVRIAGKIDRIDVSEDGSVCFVVDYKTGRLPRISDIAKGLSLQLPVYLMALEHDDRYSETFSGVSGYCHLPAAGPVEFSNVFGDLDAVPEVLNRPSTRGDLHLSQVGGLSGIAERIQDICSDIRSGQFTTTRIDQGRAGCRYCEFYRVCRNERTDPV